MQMIKELENCKTSNEIDFFLTAQDGITSTQDKCKYLIKYMGIIDVYFDDGDETEPESLYSLLRETFCDGDWRLICGVRS